MSIQQGGRPPPKEVAAGVSKALVGLRRALRRAVAPCDFEEELWTVLERVEETRSKQGEAAFLAEMEIETAEYLRLGNWCDQVDDADQE